MPSYANPQSLNRYGYVLNNPQRYSDPSGHMPDDGCHSEGCSYTVLPENNYCTTHPWACGGSDNRDSDNGGNGLCDNRPGTCGHPNSHPGHDEDEVDFHLEIGNTSCDLGCQQSLQGLFVAATTLDLIATGLNFGYALVADIAFFIGGPVAYGAMEVTYQGLSIVPNLIGSTGGALWIYSGFLSGENHFEMTVNDGVVNVSGSVAQDTIATVLIDGAGWSPLGHDPNIATAINGTGAIYDILRNPFDPILPTYVQPTFSFTVNTNLGIP